MPIVSKRAADQRAKRGRDTKNQAEKGVEHGSPTQGNERNHDHDAAAVETGHADASDGASNDEGSRAGSGAAKSGANLKDEDGGEEHPFRRVELVDGAEKRSEDGGSQHVGAAIPAYILDRVKLVGDAGDGGRNNHSILSRS